MSDDITYEYKSVQAMRGMESRAIAKVQSEGGWELFDQTQATLRTTLKFRRPKPETLLSKAWKMFRGLAPVQQRVVAAGISVLLLFAAVGIGTSAAQEKDATKSSATAAVSEEAAASPTPTLSEEADRVTNAENSVTRPSPSAAASEVAVSSSTPPLPETDQVINAENNKEFAALLAATDYCDPSIAQFATTYQGRKIEFDGSITTMQRHEDYSTRYDILLGPGNAGPKTTAGPAFKYGNVNMFDLKFPGQSAPSYVSEGDTFRFTAEVGEYKPSQGCLFFLTPVSTTVR